MSLICVGRADAQGLSPGPLTRAHSELEGASRCTDCHSSGHGIDPQRCLHCHEALGRRIRARQGYHGQLRGRPCQRCHMEHRGRSAPLIRWPEGGRARFDHTRLAGFELRGAHAELRCRQCHDPAHIRAADVQAMPPSERGSSYLGLGSACTSCHRDPHAPSLGARCASCHDQRDWNATEQNFDHARARFPLRGAHARVDCAGCHPTAREGEPASFRGLRFQSCTNCHEDPHAGAMGSPAQCGRCHTSIAWDRVRFIRSTHAPRKFPLAGAHAELACARCHGERNAQRPDRACASCHQNAHQPSLGADCAGCHTTVSWLRGGARRRDVRFHERTHYPLRGAHRAVACASCHDPRRPARRRYRPIAHDACKDCHEDPHAGQLEHRADSGACDACHSV
ncbi:MAG: cytochrome c3 family protein, partial [Deltaproteobacteria bacterium]|nr:cytochrome c3 family protein [Deltaproteobacteria bacterium]